MNELRINLHSFIDVITNSSTEIFVNVNDNAINTAHEIINDLLSKIGVDKKSEDLFDIYYEISGDVIDRIERDDGIEAAEKNLLQSMQDKKLGELDKQTIEKVLGNDRDNHTQSVELIIQTKDGKDCQFINNIRGLFSEEAYYNG